MSDLASRRAALEAERDQLQRARGAAALDGKPFDGKRLAAVESELAALSDAEGEAIRRQSEAAAKRDSEDRAAMRARIGDLDKERLAAVAEAEVAARQAVAAMHRAQRLAAEITGAAADLRIPQPVALARKEVEVRLSRYLAALLVPAPQWQYGILEWGSLPEPSVPDWTAAERAATASAISSLVEEQVQ